MKNNLVYCQHQIGFPGFTLSFTDSMQFIKPGPESAHVLVGAVWFQSKHRDKISFQSVKVVRFLCSRVDRSHKAQLLCGCVELQYRK
eukprot:scaffold11525_cov135-Cylindrotheca_fusiformis.AAC.10